MYKPKDKPLRGMNGPRLPLAGSPRLTPQTLELEPKATRIVDPQARLRKHFGAVQELVAIDPEKALKRTALWYRFIDEHPSLENLPFDEKTISAWAKDNNVILPAWDALSRSRDTAHAFDVEYPDSETLSRREYYIEIARAIKEILNNNPQDESPQGNSL